MQLEDWSKRWEDKRTNWHAIEFNKNLVKYFPVDEKPLTFFPLCGKTLDMIWVAQQGATVRGAEFSQLAIDLFFEENKLEKKTDGKTTSSETSGTNISITSGDFFDYPEDGAKMEFIFDRGSMVAINPSDREKYGEKIKQLLSPNGKVILEALSRDEEHLTSGPPFHLAVDEVEAIYEKVGLKVKKLESYEDDSKKERFGVLTVNVLQISF